MQTGKLTALYYHAASKNIEQLHFDNQMQHFFATILGTHDAIFAFLKGGARK